MMEYHKILLNLIDRFYDDVEIGDILKGVVTDLVEIYGAYLSKIWLVGPGDLCGSCLLADVCASKKECLHLIVSAEKYPYTQWSYARIPFGVQLIGEIYEEGKPKLSNNVQNDERIKDQKWVRRENLISFAGYPIQYKKTYGVIAILSQNRMSIDDFEMFNSLAKLLSMTLTFRKNLI